MNIDGGVDLFQAGDKVVYPMQGAGIVKAIEKKAILGKVQEYCMIHIPICKMDVMIPVNMLEKSGVRLISDRQMMKEALVDFQHAVLVDDLPWKERYHLNLEKMKTGKMIDLVDVAQNLLLRSKEKALNSSERQMLNKVRKNLISEITLITDLTEDQAAELLKIS